MEEIMEENMTEDREAPFEGLEWSRWIEECAQVASSVPARQKLRTLHYPASWAQNLQHAQNLQLDTTQGQILDPFLDTLLHPLLDLQNPDPHFEFLARGGVLLGAELQQVRRWLRALEVWEIFRGRLEELEIDATRFSAALQYLKTPPQPHLRQLDRILTDEGGLSENASPRFRELHQEHHALKREISRQIEDLALRYHQEGLLQDRTTDVRDGRYVLPVKSSRQHDLTGAVLDFSATKQTTFIEPAQVASLNNRLRLLENDMELEAHRILKELSDTLRPHAPGWMSSCAVLIYWDVVFAKFRLSRRYQGQPIEVGPADGRWHLEGVAHPLLFWDLPREKIGRNSLKFHEPQKCLLLTGPNTGGKTVFMKTLGLSAVFARTGFFLPSSGTPPQVPFFQSIFVDIGDDQSLERHLSSFSSHIEKFKRVFSHMESCDPQARKSTLVLLDELNTATDPVEGAALGRAVLENLLEEGAWLIATTHDPGLKALALQDSRILSGSMVFDETSRAPTYELRLGIPGRSHALDTAERLGIPMSVLSRARSYLSDPHRSVESLLRELEKNHQASRSELRKAESLRESAQKLEGRWRAELQRLSKETQLEARTALDRILVETQRSFLQKLSEVERRRVESNKKIYEDRESLLRESLKRFQEEQPEVLSQSLSVDTPSEREPPRATVGDQVRVLKWKSTGEVLEVLVDGVWVQMGTMKLRLKWEEIETLPSTTKKATPKPTWNRRDDVPAQIDLRGRRFEEAMSELELYLDLSYRSGLLSQVLIIHGLGTGALREGTRKLLKKLPYIKSFSDAGPGSGIGGATQVEFDHV
jgi:DNA mismatch repair protein MutS2